MSLESILAYWFPNEKYQAFWFDRSPDECIRNEYSATLKDEEAGKFDDLTDNNSILARIILLDQFTRNLHRNSEERHKNDSKALKLSFSLLNERRDHEFPFHQRIFILMPLRHSMKDEYLRIVLFKIHEYAKTIDEYDQKLHRLFKENTIKSFALLENNIYKYNFDHTHIIGLTDAEYCDTMNFDLHKYIDIIDNNCKRYGKESEQITNNSANGLYQTMKKYVISKNLKNMAISLSGGVDSMVLLHLAKCLKIDGFLEKVMAIHMEYINRDEASLETDMLIEWCAEKSIPLIVRKIDYMQRDEVAREFYEEETRKARFGAYKFMMREYEVQGFCLGHHHGDLGENVLMNLFKGRDILDMFVMDDDSEIEGVRLLRPLLAHPKSDIYEYAHWNHIPYFLDTTPDWSCRGVLRRKIMPALTEQYGSGIDRTLAKVGEQSRDWNHIIETMVIKPFLQKCERNNECVWFEIDSVVMSQPRVFWQRVLIEIFHSVGKRMITGKNLDAMLEMLRRRFNTNKVLYLNFSNGLTAEFNKNILSIKIKK